MELNREQIKCPYVEKIKSITGKEEFDCKTCPALECPFPKVKEERKSKMELNRDEILKWWELCANDITCRKCPYEEVGNCQSELMQATLDIFKELTEKYENLEMQFREIDHECDRLEIRNEELTAKVAEWEKECDLRGDMWCKLNEENKKLTEENEAWQKQLISTEEKSEKAIYDLSCKVEDLRKENENLHASCAELTQSCTKLETLYKIECKRVDTVKADTVRKMQERLKEVSHMTYDINSVGIEGVVYVTEIDQIAKEMLGEV